MTHPRGTTSGLDGDDHTPLETLDSEDTVPR